MSRNDHWLALLLVTVTALIYAPSARFGYITLDDQQFHVESPNLDRGINADTLRWALTDTSGNYWHPVWNLVNLLAFTAFGPEPGPQHVISAALYIATTAALFYALRATTRRSAVAFVGVALWAWHPLHVENVNWLTERAGVISALLVVAAMAAYLAYGRRPSVWRYALVALCFFLALAAKPLVPALPVALLALDLWPLDRARTAWAERRWRGALWLALEKVPLLLMAVAFTASTAWMVASRAPGQQTLAGSGGPPAIPWPDALLAVPAGYVFMLAKTVVPTGLSIHYPWTMAWSRGQSLAALVMLIVLTALILRSRNRALIAGYFWFGVMLLPALAAARYRTAWVADRYVIVPHILLMAGIASAFFDATGRRPRPTTEAMPTSDAQLPLPPASLAGSTFLRRWGALAAVLAALVAISMRQVWVWRDSETLFRHAVTRFPQSETAHHCLAIALAEQGRLVEASDHYAHAVGIRPHFADARLNLGIVAERLGNFELSDRSLRAVLQLEPNNRAARFAVARLRARQGRNREAVELYGQLVREYPNDVDVHVNFGAALEVMGDRAGAEAQYREALRLDPRDPDARANLNDLLGGSLQTPTGQTRPPQEIR
ncbi:MAG: tetratricopeptide repeat protein [Planctomycetota bacterium]|nr:tetratricopeptide repeat protein [Planctomycetota bacterium]